MNLDSIKIPLHKDKQCTGVKQNEGDSELTVVSIFAKKVENHAQSLNGNDIDNFASGKMQSELKGNDNATHTDKQTKKRRKLKQRQLSNESQSSDSDSPPTPHETKEEVRQQKEEARQRRHIMANLEALELSFKVSQAVLATLSSGMCLDANSSETNVLSNSIVSGSCRFTQSFGDLSIFERAPMFSKLKIYQKCGVHWLALLHSVENANGILADEMGLGKTAQTCVFLSWLYMLEDLHSSLIIVPTTILDSWVSELERWAPNLAGKIIKYHGTQNVRFKIADQVLERVEDGESLIIVSTLGTLSSKEDIRIFRELNEFEYLIVDEAHALKNSETIAYRRLNNSFNITHRLLLTGTPVQNRSDELCNLLQFAMPDVFDQARVEEGIRYLAENEEDAIDMRPSLKDYLRGIKSHFRFTKSLDTTSMSKSSIDEGSVAAINSIGIENRKLRRLDSVDTPKNESETPLTQNEAKTELEGVKMENVADTQSIPLELRILQGLVAPFILRRLKRAVIHELPPKYTHIVKCKMTETQHKLYQSEVDLRVQSNKNESALRSICSGFLASMDVQSTEAQNIQPMQDEGYLESTKDTKTPDETESSDFNLRRDDSFIKSLIFRLRRICNHPLLVQGCFYDEDKMKVIVDHFASKVEGFCETTRERVDKEIRNWCDFEVHRAIRGIVEAGDKALAHLQIPPEMFLQSAKVLQLFEIINDEEKVLVFSQFTTYLDVIEECLAINGNVQFLRLDGALPAKDRRDVVNRFVDDPKVKVLLISTKAGGLGLNLTVAKTVVLMDQDWNPHNDAQAEDRAHRIGQTKPVHVHRLCCENSVEEYILECCKRKLRLDDAFGGKMHEG
ncbi:helicase family member protein [Theileria equi strain WA]|uniref:Helicase family member protein n=1 Tax=Theileria equi strain WA TaxID=1537102 RepID=L0AZ90_THEEQ|nr:helicase family member protein [Theileria equi strain WA]AFZ80882.1 helicase family member protein [Theileria equi strain WA]|eukprot:XP_004830548.1 helicase family member protein [Theileria equi strain WA]